MSYPELTAQNEHGEVTVMNVSAGQWGPSKPAILPTKRLGVLRKA